MLRTMRKISPRGDDAVTYDVDTMSQAELDKIGEEFQEWLRNGGIAADVTDKRDVIIREFDPTADIVLIPRVQGGR